MQVFGFDLLAYPQHLDHLKEGGELPYPLSKQHFRSDLAVQNYREHLDAWVRLEEMGFDGIGFNEHHTSPYGLMTSPAEGLGAGTLLLNFNQGAMPHDMFMRNVQRFGEEVLPGLQAHAITTVPLP